MSHPTSHKRALRFARRWAVRDSDGEIANLARAYMRVSSDLSAMVIATKELHRSLGEQVRQTMHANPEWRSGIVAVEPLMLGLQQFFDRREHEEESEP